jgi:hypothetical protein
MRKLARVLDDTTPDIDHASGVQSRMRVRADTVLAALDPSSWEFRAGASFCRPTLGCKHVAGAETDNPYALLTVDVHHRCF